MTGRTRWVVALASIGVIVLMARRTRKQTGRHDGDERGAAVPVEPRPRETLVDLASEDSFPASDPPSYWGRETPPA